VNLFCSLTSSSLGQTCVSAVNLLLLQLCMLILTEHQEDVNKHNFLCKLAGRVRLQWGKKQRQSEGAQYDRPDRPTFRAPCPNIEPNRAMTGAAATKQEAAGARAAAGAIAGAQHPAQMRLPAAAAAAADAADAAAAQAEPVNTSQKEIQAAKCLFVMHSLPVRPPDSKCSLLTSCWYPYGLLLASLHEA